MNTIDRKGILWYLGITFAITYAVEIGVLAITGVRFDSPEASGYGPYMMGQYMVAALMWAPAMAAFITTRAITKEGRGALGLRFGPGKPYVIWMGLMPVIFAVIYGLTWLLGLTHLDLQMTAFMETIAATGADMSDAPPAPVLIGLLFFASTVTIPVVNSLFALGEEIGWRGFLLPKLLPLGRMQAHILMGIIWALWHAPLIIAGFAYPRVSPMLGILAFAGLLIALSVVIDELVMRNKQSTILAAWLHGLFNSQKLGIWTLILPVANPLVGGYTGLVGIVIWAVIGVLVLRHTVPQTSHPQGGAKTYSTQGSATAG